ncbi:MAG: calcium-binding protein, partial [Cyanobacteria bacterium J06642_2]
GLGDAVFSVFNFTDAIGTSNSDSIVGDDNDNVFGGSEGNDVYDGRGGDDTVDYSNLSEKVTLKAVGEIDKGAAGTDEILAIETIIGASGQRNLIDGTVAGGGPASFDIDLSANSLTVAGIPGLGDAVFSVFNFTDAIGTSNSDSIVGDDTDNVFGGSRDDDLLDGQGGIDTADYSDLGQAITLEQLGLINKGSAGTDQILNIETIVGAEDRDNTIDGSTGTSGVTSFEVDLSAQSLTVRDIPVLGDQSFTVENFVRVIGTSNADDITGDGGDNFLDGEGGGDILIGGGGDDRLRGRSGDDTLVGVDPTSATPGAGEVDRLVGDNGADTIVLGDGTNVFYSFSGNGDFADIRGFVSGTDTIELTGSLGDYFFNGDNTEIFLNSNNDLIARFTNGAFDPNVDFSFV